MYKLVFSYKDDFHEVKVTEHAEGIIFLHCSYLDKPTKTSIIEARKIFNWMCFELYHIGYDYLFALTPTIKFVNIIDKSYKHIQTEQVDNKTMELIVWDLK